MTTYNSYYINLSGTLTEFGEQNVFTFDATAGDRISLDELSAGANIRLELISPSGYTIDSSIYDDGPYTLLETGTYKILVEDTSNSTSSYNYNLIKWNQAPTLSLGTNVTGTLIPGRENDIYRFTGTKGQRLQFDSTTATNGAYWSVYGPNGQRVGSYYNNSTDFTVNLPSNGEYYLVLEGYSNSNFSYSFQVNDISDATVTPSGFGTTQTGTISAGQTATFNYTGNAGQFLFFDSLDVDYDSIQVELRYSDNTLVYSGNASNDYSTFVLPRSGNYTVTVRGSSTNSIGDYSFRLLDLNSNSTALTLGTAVSGTLTNPSETRVLRFTGAVGQRLYFDSLDVDYDSISALIVGPSGNTVLSNNNASYDRDLFTLTEAGTYYLVLSGTGTTGTPDYNFNLLTPPTTNLAFDTAITANLAAQETELYQFTGTAGQRLYFDSQTTGVSGSWSLYGPNNQYITGSGLSGDFQATLSNDGTYVLVIQGSTTAANFNFQVVTPTTTTSALTLNTPISGTISELGEQDIYTFTGTAGQQLYYDSLKTDTSDIFSAYLVSPNGSISLLNQEADNDRDLFVLSETGTYQLVISSSAYYNSYPFGDTGTYNFNLLTPPTTNLAFDTTITANLAAQETELYQFTGTAGQRLYFDSQTSTISGSWSLRGPNNQTISGASSGLSGDFQATLPNDGTYVLVVDSSNSTAANFNFQVITPTTTTSALTLNTPVSSTISELGEQDIYTFTGTAGQRLYYDNLKTDTSDIFSAYLVSPSGSISLLNQEADNDRDLFVLTESGTYQLVINSNAYYYGYPYNDDTGTYNFNLLTPPTTNLAFDTTITANLAAQETELYQFTGTAGQRLYFDSQTTGISGTWSLRGSNNQTISNGSNSLSGDLQTTLPYNGTYVLVIDSSNSTAANFNFQVITPTTTTSALTLNTPVSSTISKLGEQDIYTFTGTAGQQLYYDNLKTDTSDIFSAYLVSPSGTTIFNQQADSDYSFFTLTQTGTYQLIISSDTYYYGYPYDGDTGTYNFNLLNAGSSPVLPLGSAVTGTLTGGRETDIYRFTGTAGQRLQFDSTTATNGAYWSVYGPNGQRVGSYYNNSTDFTVNLPSNGEYYLVLEGYSNSNFSYSFQVNDISDATVTPSGFGTTQTGTISAGQTATFNYTGNAGQFLFFDSLDVDYDSIQVELRYSDNTLVYSTNASYDSTTYINGGAIILPRSGNYTVTVKGNNTTSTGDYSFRLLDLNSSSTALTLGTAVSGTLTNPSETRVLSFTGAVGQRLYFDALDVDYDSINALIVGPSGNLILNNSNASYDSNLFTLTEAGTYYLILSGTGTTGTPDYSFNLLTPPNTNLAFDTAITANLAAQETELYQFTGTAGQRLYFDSQTSSISASWYLRGPNNQNIVGYSLTSDFQQTLTADGTYVLSVQGSNSTAANFDFQIVTPTTTTSALTLNTPISGTISELGEQDIYTFTGTVGQQLYYDNLKTDTSDTLRAYLVSPSGSTSLLNQDADYDRDLFTLTETGTYQLVIDSAYYSYNGYTGTYNFNLLTPPNTNLAFDTVTTANLSAQETELYKFTGTAGQRLYFDSQTSTISGSWSLRGPNNQTISGASSSLSYDFQTTLPYNGTYVLVVEGSNSTAANFDFQIVTPTTTTSALTLNTPVSGTISKLGEQDIYTFTGTAGQRLYYDNLKTDTSDTLRAYLVSPSGTSIFNSEADNDRDLFTLTETGTYQLVIDSYYNYYTNDTGTYNFNLLTPPTTNLAFDTVTTANLAAQETELYKFTGTAGQRLYFDSQTTGISGYWRLYDPNNQYFSYYNLSSDFQATLPSNGTYVLVVDSSNSTAANFNFQVITPDTPITGGPALTVNDATGLANAAIPLNISVDFADSDGNDIRTILISGLPSGATLSAGTNNNNGSYTLTPAQLTGLTVTPTTDADFILTVTATASETAGDTAYTTADLQITVNESLPTVSLAVAPASVTEDGVNNILYTFTRTGSTTNALTVNFTRSGSADITTDYTQTGATITGNNGTITFAAGSSTATITVNPTQDSTVESDEIVGITLATGTGYTVGTAGTVNSTILNDDSPLPNISFYVTPGSVAEDGTTNLSYVFTRTGSTTNALTVNFTLSGSATLSTDYTQTGATLTGNNGTITFAAGSNTATITVNPTADNDIEPDETVGITLASNPLYNISTTGTVTGTINNDDANVAVAVAPTSVLEDGTTNLVYTFTRTGLTTNALTVNFTLSGSATLSTDYTQTGATLTGNNGTITFAAGSSTATLTVNPTADTTAEGNESIGISLVAGTGYVVDNPSAATGIILNDDTEVTLSISPSSVDEDGTTNLVYTFIRTGILTNALTVNFSLSGDATLGTDYTQTGATLTGNNGTITFAAGSNTATITVDPTADTDVEPNETVGITLDSGTGYTVGTAGTVTGNITNDDVTVLPLISLALNSTTVTENGSLNLLYTFTRTGDLSSPLTVNFGAAGTALNITDYRQRGASSFNGITGTIVFAANSSTAVLTIDPTGDKTFIPEPDKTVEIAIAAGTGYTISTATPLTGTILNDDGDAGNNYLIGSSGNDTLNGGAGDDTMEGLAGNDTYYVDSLGDVIIEAANQGTDTVISSVTIDLNGTNLENVTLIGTDNIDATGNNFNNTLNGNSGNNVLTGNGGNDNLNGGLGNDTLIGGLGNDSYTVDASDTFTENAGEGTDTLRASFSYDLNGSNFENLTLTGTGNFDGTGDAGNNTIVGNSGNNNLSGNGGNDNLSGGLGNDTLIGGTGNDFYTIDAGDSVTENAGEGTDTLSAPISYSLIGTNIENLTLTGTTAINGTGNDDPNILNGNSKNNTITGNGGNDTINGGLGSDTLIGGTGDDRYTIDATDTVTENAGEGTDSVSASFSFDLTGTNIENLTLTGTTAINGTGDSTPNLLTGNSGNNTLTGNGGNDLLNGGSGNDILVGGDGNDSLTGGAGLDEFVYNSVSEGVDRITDFRVTDDTLVLSVSGFGGGLAIGTLASNQFRIGANATTATTADHRVIYNSTNGALFFDADGLGGSAATQFATLNSKLLLTNADFSVIA